MEERCSGLVLEQIGCLDLLSHMWLLCTQNGETKSSDKLPIPLASKLEGDDLTANRRNHVARRIWAKLNSNTISCDAF